MANTIQLKRRASGVAGFVLITASMVQGMAPGSIIVDLAAETGGNVEGAKPGEDVLVPAHVLPEH